VQEGKLSLESKDIAEEKRQELLRLFPEAQTEGGKIDFDQLKRILGESVDAGRERYGMNWPGKADCFRLIQSPSTATLLPVREESVRFDETENMIIEGDNLEVLKLLQKGYQNKVKMIYIDPPYNTGNDFIYPDDFTDNLKNYLQYTGQVDAEGKRFSDNLETDGRFHSKWLNMMYPRLYLARNLLSETGVIFISIDDAEVDNLRQMCSSIFGEDNFVAQLVWEKGRKNDAQRFSVGHEYILAFARNLGLIEDITKPWRESKPGIDVVVDEYLRLKALHGTDYKLISEGLVNFYKDLPEDSPAKKYARSRFVDSRGIWRDNNIGWPGGNGPRYELLHPKTHKPCKIPDDGWRFIETTMKQKVRDGYIEFREDHTKSPFLKSYLYVDDPESASEEDEQGDKQQVMGSVFYRHTQPASEVHKGLFAEKIFENPKDHEVIARLIRYCTGPTDIVLDFFAGSGTTAHSVLDLNAKGRSARKFILVQLPEPTNREDYKTIADITRERVRRVIQQFEKESEGKLDLRYDDAQSHEEGFRVFRLAPSNFKVWDAHTDEGVQGVERQMELAVNHIMPDRTADDLFYEILMKSEYPLTAKVENFDAAGIPAISVEEDALIVCVERKVTTEAVAVIAKRKPSKVIFLDEAFSGNDQLKANAKMNFESAGVKRFETV